MTPNDRKIEIMNRTYASTVHNLTQEIIELKMNQDPQIGSTDITLPTNFSLQMKADIAEFEVRRIRIENNMLKVSLVAAVIVVCIFSYIAYLGVNGAL